MIELFCISNFYIFQYFRLYNHKEKTRKSKANDEEECSPGSLNKIENHSTEKYIMHCSNSNENLTRLQLLKSSTRCCEDSTTSSCINGIRKRNA